ncbi:unnamed protein product [Sphagnum troendelagicum]|uniref:Uncharacterized protein n=1 Tax=Sphagnum troendelagicum TaxID=128251 RepID=A0ABP0UJX5_9BRYO
MDLEIFLYRSTFTAITASSPLFNQPSSHGTARPPVVPCLRNGGIRFTIIGNKYYFEPSSSAAHHLQQRLKAKLGDVRSAVDDDFIELAISRRHLHNQKENLEEEDDLLLANAVQIEQQDLFPQLFA